MSTGKNSNGLCCKEILLRPGRLEPQTRSIEGAMGWGQASICQCFRDYVPDKIMAILATEETTLLVIVELRIL